jgi:hypothetical protein
MTGMGLEPGAVRPRDVARPTRLRRALLPAVPGAAGAAASYLAPALTPGDAPSGAFPHARIPRPDPLHRRTR